MLAQHFAQNCDLRRGLLHKSKLKGLKNLFSSYLPIYQNLTFLLVQTIADNNHKGSSSQAQVLLAQGLQVNKKKLRLQ